MSTTFARPFHSFHVALSPEALAQAAVTPDFEIIQGGVVVDSDANGQYPLELDGNRLKFQIAATGYAANVNPVPPWVPSDWNLPGTGNYVLIGLFDEDNGEVNTAQTFWAHGGNQELSNIPDYEVPILNNDTFTIPRTELIPLLSFDVEVKTDGQGDYLQEVNANNVPIDGKIRPIVETGRGSYWQLFTTAAFGQRNPVQEVVRQIILA